MTDFRVMDSDLAHAFLSAASLNANITQTQRQHPCFVFATAWSCTHQEQGFSVSSVGYVQSCPVMRSHGCVCSVSITTKSWRRKNVKEVLAQEGFTCWLLGWLICHYCHRVSLCVGVGSIFKKETLPKGWSNWSHRSVTSLWLGGSRSIMRRRLRVT